MSLYKRGDVWWYDITHGGARHRGSTECREKAAATRFHDELKVELWKQSRSGATLHAALDAWAADKGEPDRYRVAKLKRLTKGNPLLGDIDPDDLARLLPQKSGTFNRYVNLLHAAGITGIKRKKSPKGRIRWLTAEEWEALRKAMPDAWRPMADFAIATGLRQANVFWLEWEQVDMARGRAWIHPDEAKGREPIGVKLPSAALQVLAGQRGLSDVWVFPMRDGNPLPKLKTRDWKAVVSAAGIRPCTWHDLRHTWATWHVMQGTPLKVLKELGAWKDMRMVERYAHLAESFVDQYAENAVPYSHTIRHTDALSA